MLMIVTTIILLILTIILLSGKGGFLVAGYNTLSKKEKLRYNGKKVSRIMGVLLAFITGGMAADILFGKYLAEHSGMAFIGTLLWLLICIIITYKIWKEDA